MRLELPGRDDGELDAETLVRIESTLGGLAEGLPVLLALPHPPVPLHHPLPDSRPLRDAGRPAGLPARRPRIAGLITGHAHTPAATTFAGRPVPVGPG